MMKGGWILIQKFPYYKRIPENSPVYCNLQPVYIDKYDRNVKINGRNSIISAKPNNPVKPLQMNGSEQQPRKENRNSLPVLFSPPALPISKSINTTNKQNMEKTQHYSGPKTRFTGDELLNLDTSLYQDIVEDLIPAEETTLFAGQGDSGKSLFYLQLCISIVKGATEFIGKKINTKYRSALIIATEDNEKRIAIRIQKQAKNISGVTDSCKSLVVQTTGEDLFLLLRKELEEKEFDIVVLDALGDILQGDINFQSEVRQFYNRLEQLIKEFKCSFLLVHHEGKSPNLSRKQKILGSVAIVDRARNVIMITKDPKSGLRNLTIEKSNNLSDDKKGKPIKLKFDINFFTYSLAGNYDVTADINSETSLAAEISRKQQSAFATSGNVNSKSRKNKPGRKRDEEKVTAAFAYSDQGCTLEEIGDILNVNKTTVHRWLKNQPK